MQSNKIIFDVSLAYLRVLESQIVQCNDLSNINKIISPDNKVFLDTNRFMREIEKAQHELQQKNIDFYRPVCHKEVLDEITKEMESSCSKRKSKN